MKNTLILFGLFLCLVTTPAFSFHESYECEGDNMLINVEEVAWATGTSGGFGLHLFCNASSGYVACYGQRNEEYHTLLIPAALVTSTGLLTVSSSQNGATVHKLNCRQTP